MRRYLMILVCLVASVFGTGCVVDSVTQGVGEGVVAAIVAAILAAMGL